MVNAARIRWRCRRGMLELDAILLAFFQQHFSNLSEEQQSLFAELLEEEDPDLQMWLVVGDENYPEQFTEIIGLIRGSHAKHSAS